MQGQRSELQSKLGKLQNKNGQLQEEMENLQEENRDLKELVDLTEKERNVSLYDCYRPSSLSRSRICLDDKCPPWSYCNLAHTIL